MMNENELVTHLKYKSNNANYMMKNFILSLDLDSLTYEQRFLLAETESLLTDVEIDINSLINVKDDMDIYRDVVNMEALDMLPY